VPEAWSCSYLTYDRSPLIEASVATLREKLSRRRIIVSLVVSYFLISFPQRTGGVMTLPMAVLLAFWPSGDRTDVGTS